MRKSAPTDKSLHIAFIFFLLCLFLVVGALGIKIFLLYRSSHFDSVNQFILEVDEDGNRGALISFLPNKKSIAILHITGKVDKGFGAYLGVPIDASLTAAFSSDTNQLMQEIIFHGEHESHFTLFDKMRLFFFINSLKQSDYREENITLPIDATTSEKVLPGLFLDSHIYTDNESVAIVNQTGVAGIGNDVAKELSVIGVNVISVTGGNSADSVTTVLSPHVTYTSQRITYLLHAKQKNQTGSVFADITVIIGKKSLPDIQ